MALKILITAVLLLLVAVAVGWYWIAHSERIWGNLSKIKGPLVVFDFDGTICPSYPLLIQQINAMARKYKLRKISPDQAEPFRNMSPQAMIQAVGASMWQLPFFLRRARLNVQECILALEPVPGIIETLQQLKTHGFSLGILSSNSQKNIHAYLKKYQISCFDFVYTSQNIFGKDKHLKKILQQTGLQPERDQLIYIGDEIRDIEAAKKAYFKNIGVTWGYNSPHILQQSKPDFVCEKPDHLLSWILTNTNP
jgi:phosphoglycolate phosphatase